MSLPIIFVAGLPRSGSTLLQNVLMQCPQHHATATNDVIECVNLVRDNWMKYDGFKAQGLSKIEPRIANLLCGMMYGFYQDEILAGKTIFDKSRGWLFCIELLETILDRPVKVIVTVRDIRDVVASFEKLFRKSALTRHPALGEAYFDVQTVDGRARQLLHPQAVLGLAVRRVLDAFDRGLQDRLVIVPYKELTEQPQLTLARIHLECGLMPFVYDTDNVEQVIHEDDDGYGYVLHQIRSKIEPEFKSAWQGVIPERVAEWLVKEYSDIQYLANRSYNRGFANFLRDGAGLGGDGSLRQNQHDAG